MLSTPQLPETSPRTCRPIPPRRTPALSRERVGSRSHASRVPSRVDVSSSERAHGEGATGRGTGPRGGNAPPRASRRRRPRALLHPGPAVLHGRQRLTHIARSIRLSRGVGSGSALAFADRAGRGSARCCPGPHRRRVLAGAVQALRRVRERPRAGLDVFSRASSSSARGWASPLFDFHPGGGSHAAAQAGHPGAPSCCPARGVRGGKRRIHRTTRRVLGELPGVREQRRVGVTATRCGTGPGRVPLLGVPRVAPPRRGARDAGGGAFGGCRDSRGVRVDVPRPGGYRRVVVLHRARFGAGRGGRSRARGSRAARAALPDSPRQQIVKDRAILHRRWRLLRPLGPMGAVVRDGGAGRRKRRRRVGTSSAGRRRRCPSRGSFESGIAGAGAWREYEPETMPFACEAGGAGSRVAQPIGENVWVY